MFNMFVTSVILGVQTCLTYQIKVCQGTDNGLTKTGNGSHDLYDRYKKLYDKNCTVVDGNLEITYLYSNFNLDFLSSIEVVTGYVLIYDVYCDYVPLHNLSMIRGETLDKSGSSLHVVGSKGLKELQFKSLSEISKGNVYFYNNVQLCFEDSILWDDIFRPDSGQEVTFDTVKKSSECGECDERCETYSVSNDGNFTCWGKGPDFCQKLNRKNCAPQCDDLCFGENANQCCNSECAGGCTGASDRECDHCDKFNNNGTCVADCPGEWIYHSAQLQWVLNPDPPKVSYAGECLDQCPNHMVQYRYPKKLVCLTHCPEGYLNSKGICQPCEKGRCPKTCTVNDAIDETNIDELKGCTTIIGSIAILEHSLKKMHPSKLSALADIEEIKGYLQVEASNENFTSLGFLQQLRIIRGQQLFVKKFAVYIVESSIKTLNLASLKEITTGRVVIGDNVNLCYAETINWKKLMGNKKDDGCKFKWKSDKVVSCSEAHHANLSCPCSTKCSDDGCWGPGADKCVSCRNYAYENTCVDSCEHLEGVYDAGNKTCLHCHEQCQDGCAGPEAYHCLNNCKNFINNQTCVAHCPIDKYPSSDNSCMPCHHYCKYGCSGPSVEPGEGGCHKCSRAIKNSTTGEVACDDPRKKGAKCNTGFYKNRRENITGINTETCITCHLECVSCHGAKNYACDQCKHVKDNGRCVVQCSEKLYRNGSMCEKCHDYCEKCHGAGQYNCITCARDRYKLFDVESTDVLINSTKFNCTGSCPLWAPHKKTLDSTKEVVCSEREPNTALQSTDRGGNYGVVIGVTIGGAVLVLAVVLVICLKKTQRKKFDVASRMGIYDSHDMDTVPLSPNAEPDMASLKLINVSELIFGPKVGSGAFGTVFEGVWKPVAGNDNVKMPIAIKVLREGVSANQNRELLDEARLMASVVNKYCVPLYGVCMTKEMQLVTQFMPLGSLQDYVKNKKAIITSKAMLKWCKQIAKGMAYLEESGIVHRDLAARNVLVKSPECVLVTDFGMSRLLDEDQAAVKVTQGELLPLKWLALESLQSRIFTHRSDVWSYGITLWEIFTYGEKPYGNVTPRQMLDLLEQGDRLPQPDICSDVIYLNMNRCWLTNQMQRPSFTVLANEFSRLLENPDSYFVKQHYLNELIPVSCHDLKKKSITQNNNVRGCIDKEDYMKAACCESGREKTLSMGSDCVFHDVEQHPMAVDNLGYLNPQSMHSLLDPDTAHKLSNYYNFFDEDEDEML